MTNKCRECGHPLDTRTRNAGGEICFDCIAGPDLGIYGDSSREQRDGARLDAELTANPALRDELTAVHPADAYAAELLPLVLAGELGDAWVCEHCGESYEDDDEDAAKLHNAAECINPDGPAVSLPQSVRVAERILDGALGEDGELPADPASTRRWRVERTELQTRVWFVNAPSEDDALDTYLDVDDFSEAESFHSGHPDVRITEDVGTTPQSVRVAKLTADVAPPYICDECGATIPFNACGQSEDTHHARSCSLRPEADAAGYATPQSVRGALASIVALLDECEWTAETCDEIAAVCRRCGFTIRDINDDAGKALQD